MTNERYETLSDALEAAVAMSNGIETSAWVGRNEQGYVVCAYTQFPEGADIVCTVDGAAALQKLWNSPKPRRRKR